jgi:hypothetical protein
MATLRSVLFAAMLVVAAVARADAPDRSGAHGFDFLFGDWRVHHRLMRANGVALRAYDAVQDHWSIWWLDSRYPSGPLPAPNVGRFENGVGMFYADLTDNGKTIRSRLQWSDITATSARWEQAYSYDGGKTWDTNWIMTLERRS